MFERKSLCLHHIKPYLWGLFPSSSFSIVEYDKLIRCLSGLHTRGAPLSLVAAFSCKGWPWVVFLLDKKVNFL